MSQIFISYAHADAQFADLLHLLLEAKGYTVWIDSKNLRAGSHFHEAIGDAIKSSKVLIVILSGKSVTSKYVADEWNYALDQKHKVIPILFKPCDIPFRLNGIQYIDFHSKDATSLKVQRLTDELDRHVTRNTPAAPPAPQSHNFAQIVTDLYTEASRYNQPITAADIVLRLSELGMIDPADARTLNYQILKHERQMKLRK